MLLSPVDFATKYFYFDKASTKQGKFDIDECEFLRDIMESFADITVRSGACMCSAQSGKTQTGIILGTWALSEDPGPFMWTLPARDEALTFAKARLKDSFERCEPLTRIMPTTRGSVTNLEINFGLAPFMLIGVSSGSKVSGKPIRWLFIDEEKDYGAASVPKLLKRVRSKWNAKIWRMSTPSKDKDSIHLAFLAGDQRHYHVHCPKCHNHYPLRWKNLVYPNSEEDDFEIHYRCHNDECEHKWFDNPADRRAMVKSGKWIANNPLMTEKGQRSWTWNAILPEWVAWADIVEEWKSALEAREAGDDVPFITFLNETICEPFNEKMLNEAAEFIPGGYFLADYFDGQGWEMEKERYMTVDKQRGHYFAVVRAWRSDGSSRQVYRAKVLTREDLRATQIRMKVKDRMVFIDARWQESDVYDDCAEFGWTAIKGDARRSFVHSRPGKPPIIRLYSPIQRIGHAGKIIPLVYLCTDELNSVLQKIITGMHPRVKVWEIPSFPDKETEAKDVFEKHMNNEVHKEVVDSKTKRITRRWVKIGPNHFRDCEAYQIGAALMMRTISGHERMMMRKEVAKMEAEDIGVDSEVAVDVNS